MISALTVLLACQLAGEVLVRLVALPIPGPVLGMAMLFLGLLVRQHWWSDAIPVDQLALGSVAGALLANLSLLFVPAGAGIISHAGTLLSHGPSLLAALCVSAAVTLVVTAFVFVRVSALVGSKLDADS